MLGIFRLKKPDFLLWLAEVTSQVNHKILELEKEASRREVAARAQRREQKDRTKESQGQVQCRYCGEYFYPWSRRESPIHNSWEPSCTPYSEVLQIRNQISERQREYWSKVNEWR